MGIDADNDGFFDNTEIFAETVTDANGFYKFNDLVPGQYQVFFQTPNGYNSVSPQGQEGDNTKDSDGLLSDVVTLASGEYNPTINAGMYKNRPTSSLGDFVWNDQQAFVTGELDPAKDLFATANELGGVI